MQRSFHLHRRRYNPGRIGGTGRISVVVSLCAMFACLGAEPPPPSRLIEQLAAADYGVREEAQRQLHALGAAAKPALLAAKNGPDVEQRLRVESLLRDIRRVELWAPSIVSMEMPQASLHEALTELEKQSGNHINWSRTPKTLAEKLPVQLQKRTYWEALDALCRKGNVSAQFYDDPSAAGCILTRGAPGNFPTAYVGPLRMRLQSLQRSLHQEHHYGDGATDAQDTVTLAIQVHWEQRAVLCRYGARPTLLEARTDGDEDLKVSRRGRNLVQPLTRRQRELSFNLPLGIPLKPAAKLAKLRIGMEAEIAGDFMELKLPIKQAGAAAEVDGYRLVLEQIKREPAGTMCVVRLQRAEPADTAQNLPDLVDECFTFVREGRPLTFNALRTIGSRSGVQYTFVLSGRLEANTEVRCSVPRLRSRRMIEFVFENVALFP